LPELAQEADLDLRNTDYHLRVLQTCGATRAIPEENASGGMVVHQSIVSKNQWVRAQLAATAAEDERATGRRSGQRPRKAI
jgi:hypothetical protein